MTDTLLEEQRRTIDDLRAEVVRCKRQIAQRDEMTSSDPKGPLVAFLTPAYAGLKPSYVTSLVGSMRLLAREGYRTMTIFSWGCSIISNARTELFGEAWRSNVDIYVMIDSDIGWEPLQLLKAIQFDEPLVVFPVPVRTVDLDLMIARDRKSEGVTFNVWPSVEEIAGRPRKQGFVRIDSAGGAFTVMKKAAAESLMRHNDSLAVRVGKTQLKSWALWHPMLHDGVEMGEDTSFFARWRGIGGEVWCLPDAVTSHAGELVIESSLAERLNPEGPDDRTSLSTTRYGG